MPGTRDRKIKYGTVLVLKIFDSGAENREFQNSPA
jgi:hypothetical protein